MCFRVIPHLVAHSRAQNRNTASVHVRVKLPFQTKQNMALVAPMVGKIPSGVFDHPHANVSEIPRAPNGSAGFSRIGYRFHLPPVYGFERKVRDVHVPLILPPRVDSSP